MTTEKMKIVITAEGRKRLTPEQIEEIKAQMQDQIATVPAERQDGIEVTWIPRSLDEFMSLYWMRRDQLLEIGLVPWKDDDPELWLFPVEWYDDVPTGLKVTDISGQTHPFSSQRYFNEARLGLLSFGLRFPKAQLDT